ncbi:hypothetical protein RBEAN4_0717 [Rickettsia bellii str. RML An4]|uniref:Uncharacterized protein n=1 Tax=Rickettsia bellii str. RML An4 TaxID=1359193 RepID=A0A0F3QAX6_RICBE|nr:hypothetical protein RBEAN4_0717 [Rickettsia bellii str. RML An4]
MSILPNYLILTQSRVGGLCLPYKHIEKIEKLKAEIEA